MGSSPFRIVPRAGSAAVILALAAWASVAAGEAPLPDPTRPPGVSGGPSASQESEKPKAELNLQSLLHGGERALAVINGRSLQEGDSIHGYTVTRIARDQVVLRGGGGTRVLRLISTPGMEKVPHN